MEKIQEHPAHRAARMIRELHEQNIAKIDAGTIFTKDGADVTAQIRAFSEEQIALCDKIMERAREMGDRFVIEGHELVSQIKLTLDDANKPTMSELDASIPEIGNYGHGN